MTLGHLSGCPKRTLCLYLFHVHYGHALGLSIFTQVYNVQWAHPTPLQPLLPRSSPPVLVAFVPPRHFYLYVTCMPMISCVCRIQAPQNERKHICISETTSTCLISPPIAPIFVTPSFFMTEKDAMSAHHATFFFIPFSVNRHHNVALANSPQINSNGKTHLWHVDLG